MGAASRDRPVKRHHSEGLKMNSKIAVTVRAMREAGADGSGCLAKFLRNLVVLP